MALKVLKTLLPNHFPRSWQLDGSNDNETWIMIDNQPNTNQLNGANKKYTFQVSNPGKYRYFRFTNTDSVWKINDLNIPEYFFCLAKVEFFGNLYLNVFPITKSSFIDCISLSYLVLIVILS